MGHGGSGGGIRIIATMDVAINADKEEQWPETYATQIANQSRFFWGVDWEFQTTGDQ